MASDSFLRFLSAVFGWVYFLAWSASFYPQGLLNWRRRSTRGTTVDFHFINSLGECTAPPPPSPPVNAVVATLRALFPFCGMIASRHAPAALLRYHIGPGAFSRIIASY